MKGMAPIVKTNLMMMMTTFSIILCPSFDKDNKALINQKKLVAILIRN